MAIMHPERLAEQRVESTAELFLFDEFEKQLDDTFHVFHSVTWTGNRNIRGECDFVIFKKDTGFVTLEVKGGAIEVIDNAWFSVNRYGQRLRIKDPVRQARYAQYAFKDLYRDRFHTHFPGVFSWGVCFPEVKINPGFLHRDLNRHNTLHVGDIHRLQDWIMGLFRYTRPSSRRQLSEKEVENFLSLFSVNAVFARSILFAMKKQQEELEAVDHFQDYMLNLFDDKKRVGFQGAAGTGKTWIALKKVMRLSEEGKRVLFLCFSTNLKTYIAMKLAKIPSVTVETFHAFAVRVLADFLSDVVSAEKNVDLFREFARKVYERAGEGDFYDPHAGMIGFLRWLSTISCREDFTPELERYGARFDPTMRAVLAALLPTCSDDEGFYSFRLPAALEIVFDEYTLRDQFDAIVIDEAQDFEDKWCTCIDYFFKNRADRVLYIFYDDNQSIFQENSTLPVVKLFATTHLGDYIFHLKNNVRNTPAIHEYAVRKTGLGATSTPLEISGITPEEVTFYDPEEALTYISRTVGTLLNVHGLARNSIALLSNAAWEDSIYAGEGEIAGCRLEPEPVAHSRGLGFRTVSQFKGLESDAVILLLDYGVKVSEKHHRITSELVYVGCTRAKYVLYVVNLYPLASAAGKGA